jgi:flavin reductase (DIM6/NTAB) family NADH-FMN oxidoreductase RutF
VRSRALLHVDFSVDPKTKQKTLRKLSNGVYVLTSRDGGRLGVATITWVSQASFKPPLIMAAVRKDSNVFRCLSASRIAALHIVGDGQESVAQKFFSPTTPTEGTLNGEAFTEGVTSAPILKSLPACLECKVAGIRQEYGDHAIVVLEVIEAACSHDFRALTVADSPWEYGG